MRNEDARWRNRGKDEATVLEQQVVECANCEERASVIRRRQHEAVC